MLFKYSKKIYRENSLVFNFLKKIINNVYTKGKNTVDTIETPKLHTETVTKPLSPENIEQAILHNQKMKNPNK